MTRRAAPALFSALLLAAGIIGGTALAARTNGTDAPSSGAARARRGSAPEASRRGPAEAPPTLGEDLGAGAPGQPDLPAPAGGGILDPDLQAPPLSNAEVLAARLQQLGASAPAALELTERLALFVVQDARSSDVTFLSEIATAAVRELGLEAGREAKAERLAVAFLSGRPVSLAGISVPAELEQRIDEFTAAGLDPEAGAWLALQERAPRQAGGGSTQRLDLSLSLLGVQDDTRARRVLGLAEAESAPVPADVHDTSRPGAGPREIPRLELPSAPAGTPVVNCPICPAYNYGNFVPSGTWRTHSASIPADGCRVYRFAVTAGKDYRFTFCEGGGTATFPAVLQSSEYPNLTCGTGPNGTSCGGADELDYTAPYTGFFFLNVINPSGSAGTYRLAYRDVSPQCATCPAYDYGTYTPTTVYRTQTAFVGDNECRVVRFNVTANHRYRFSLCSTDSAGVFANGSSTFSAVLSARTAACVQVDVPAPDPCDPDQEIDVTPTASGALYVTISSTGGEGNYVLAYRDVSPCASCPAYDHGIFTPGMSYATHSSSIGPDQCKLYRFNVTANRTYRFTTCATDVYGRPAGGSAAFDSVLEAYNSACALLDFDDDSCAPQSELVITPTYSGALYLRVRGYGIGDSGAFTLAYRNDAGTCTSCPYYDAAPANPTPLVQFASQSVDPNGGCRTFRYYLTVGNSYRFSFCTAGASSAFPSLLELRKSTCAVVATGSDPGCGLPEIDYTAAATGYYYLTVRGAAPSDSGAFTVAYQLLAGVCKACPEFDYGVFSLASHLTVYGHSSTVLPASCRSYVFNLLPNNGYYFYTCYSYPQGSPFDTDLKARLWPGFNGACAGGFVGTEYNNLVGCPQNPLGDGLTYHSTGTAALHLTISDESAADLGGTYTLNYYRVQEAQGFGNCSDGVDNDFDGTTDCDAGVEDPHCNCGPEVCGTGRCADSIDNDDDGATDSGDGGCYFDPCAPMPACPTYCPF